MTDVDDGELVEGNGAQRVDVRYGSFTRDVCRKGMHSPNYE